MRWMDELCIFGFHTQLHIVCTSHGDGFKQDSTAKFSNELVNKALRFGRTSPHRT